MGHNLQILVMLAGGAALLPLVARRMNVPSAIMEMVYGILLFNLFISEMPEWFVFLKELGLVYLMFMAGMELDLEGLFEGGRFYWYVLISLCSLVVTPVLFIKAGYAPYLGVVVSAASAGVILPVLKESGLLRTPVGRESMGLALTGEMLSILLIVGIYIYSEHGLTPGAAMSALKLVGVFLLALLFLRIVYLAAWWNPSKVEQVMQSDDPVEEGIRMVVFVAMAGALLAHEAGVEPILGSFIGGVIFNAVFKRKGRFEQKVSAVGFGFFTPLFFMGVGAEFDASMLLNPRDIVFSMGLTLMVAVSNVWPMVFAPLIGMRMGEALCATLLLSAPLSMMIVAGKLGLRMGLIEAWLYNSILLAAMSSGLIYPYLFRPIGRRLYPDRTGAGGI